MKRITNRDFGGLQRLRSERQKRIAVLQCMRKDGSWGKARRYDMLCYETPEQMAEQLTAYNGRQYRVAPPEEYPD